MATHIPSDFFDAQESPVPPVKLGEGTALVVVDMQYHDAHPKGAFNVAMDRILPGSMDYFNRRTEDLVVPAVRQLVDGFHDRSLPVVFLTLGSAHRDYADWDGRLREWISSVESRSNMSEIFWDQSPDHEIRDDIGFDEEDIVVAKTTFGAFNGSDIEQTLIGIGAKSLVFAGVSTNCCVEGTVRDAAERGWGSVVVAAATADYDAEAERASLRALAFNHARVARTADELLAAVDRDLDQ